MDGRMNGAATKVLPNVRRVSLRLNAGLEVDRDWVPDIINNANNVARGNDNELWGNILIFYWMVFDSVGCCRSSRIVAWF